MPDAVQLDPRHGRAAEERARRYGVTVADYVALLIDRDLDAAEGGFDAFRRAAAPVAEAFGDADDAALEALVEEARQTAYEARRDGVGRGDDEDRA